MEAIVARHPGERVAVVCSAETINAYVSMALGVQRDVLFLPGHASISTLHLSGELYAVQHLNDNAHLAPALQSY
jgi:broad specificity phosphatase PhoE